MPSLFAKYSSFRCPPRLTRRPTAAQLDEDGDIRFCVELFYRGMIDLTRRGDTSNKTSRSFSRWLQVVRAMAQCRRGCFRRASTRRAVSRRVQRCRRVRVCASVGEMFFSGDDQRRNVHVVVWKSRWWNVYKPQPARYIAGSLYNFRHLCPCTNRWLVVALLAFILNTTTCT